MNITHGAVLQGYCNGFRAGDDGGYDEEDDQGYECCGFLGGHVSLMRDVNNE